MREREVGAEGVVDARGGWGRGSGLRCGEVGGGRGDAHGGALIMG